MNSKKVTIITLVLLQVLSLGIAAGCKTSENGKHTHVYGEWQTINEATSDNSGLEERHCTGCKAKDACTIPEISEVSYSITYDFDGGEVEGAVFDSLPKEYKKTDADISINISPYKRKNIFVGWSAGDSTPTKNYIIESGHEGDLVLTACYETDTTCFYDGKAVDVLPDVVSQYLKAKNKADYLYKFYNDEIVGDDAVKSVKLEWLDSGAGGFKLVVAKDEKFENTVRTEDTTGTSVELYNLTPDAVYFYKITDKNGNVVKSDSFKSANELRTIYCGNITNVRDLGGAETADGKINYGLIYRAPEIVNADDVAKNVLVNQLGIKTEIDLRKKSTTKSISDSINKQVQWDYRFRQGV